MPTQQRKCQACGNESDECKICSSCGVTAYCDQKCQIAARPKHAPLCKEVRKLRYRVDAELARLTSEFGEDYVEENVGWLWRLGDGRGYCRAVQGLGLKLVDLAEAEENLRAFEVAGSLYLELMRLASGDNLGVRYSYSFVLLALGRVQDCYDFIAWWNTIEEDYDWGDVPELKKGEWSFGRNRDMLDDLVFGCLRVRDPDFVRAHDLTALVMIKLLLVKSLEGAEGRFYPLVSGEKADVEEQKTLAKQYHEVLRKVNPAVAAALERQDVADNLLKRTPTFPALGSLDEAVSVIKVANYFWNAAGLRSVLNELLGK